MAIPNRPQSRALPFSPVQTDAKLRLFCVPHAGGAASTYRGWSKLFPAWLQVCPIEPPGRGTRYGEPLPTKLEDWIGDLGEALRPWLDRPFLLFGHSMGALAIFELGRYLRRTAAPMPAHLVASGREPPQAKIHHKIADAADDELVEHLRRFGGTPDLVLKDPAASALFLPVLRADVRLLNGYRVTPERPLDVPLSVFIGAQDDEVDQATLPGWAEVVTQPPHHLVFPGGHFYLGEQANAVTAHLTAIAARHLPQARFG